MKLVLLPGMDGTGELFAPFLRVLPGEQEVVVITYPREQPTQPEQLVELILSQLPNKPFLLLAESYSGALAYQAALRKPEHLQGVVFVATFLTCPYPLLLRGLHAIGTVVLRVSPPNFIIRLLMLGFSANSQLLALFRTSLQTVHTDVLLQRLQHIIELQSPKSAISYPCFFLQAQHDRLVPQSSLHAFRLISNQLRIYPVAGPHLILQASPALCWVVIEEVIEICRRAIP